MFSEIINAKLNVCLEHIDTIFKYTHNIKSADEFVLSRGGLTFDGTLMRLQALTETIKKISSVHPEVIEQLNYPELSDLIKFRDYVSHHYEMMAHEVVFSIVKHDLPKLRDAISRLLS
ncbi:MAG TPA: DUF86 domain-containing protein [Agriterribacter sp.]|nr:DUF86 domain-containing protein [Agriterribacter sp.]